jgi:transcription-repair coupling factor (superfamily II helicase)
MYHLPGEKKATEPVVIISPLRALMTRTLPRRDFLVSSRTIKLGQQINPEELLRQWVGIGYEAVDTVLDFGQFSRRGGILDVWAPSEPFPARLEFFGDEVDTIRQFNPATQRTIKNLDELLISPAREYLAAKAGTVSPEDENIDEFFLPLIHKMPASLLDYLPKNTLILIDDIGNIQSFAEEIEEQAVKLRQESIEEGILTEDFPVPYITWSELIDSIQAMRWLELGRSTANTVSDLAEAFMPGERYGGRLSPFMDDLSADCQEGINSYVITRQLSRLKELWQEHSGEIETKLQPVFREGSLTEGWVLYENGAKVEQLSLIHI